MLKSIFWIPKISSLKEKLIESRNMWIELVKKELTSSELNSAFEGKLELKIKENYLKEGIFPVASFQMKILPTIALNNNLISKQDANKFFPMLAEVYCNPFKDKYDFLINRYNESENPGNLLTRFTIDVMDALFEKNFASQTVGSLIVAERYTDVLIHMTQLHIADAFNDNELARESLEKIQEFTKNY